MVNEIKLKTGCKKQKFKINIKCKNNVKPVVKQYYIRFLLKLEDEEC